MTEPLLTRREKSTLLKAGLGLGAVLWAGPQIIGILFLLLGLVVTAGLLLFVAVGAVIKYAAIALAVVFGFLLLARLFGGPSRPEPLSARLDGADLDALEQAKDRAARAALDVELAKAVRDAEAKKTHAG